MASTEDASGARARPSCLLAIGEDTPAALDGDGRTVTVVPTAAAAVDRLGGHDAVLVDHEPSKRDALAVLEAAREGEGEPAVVVFTDDDAVAREALDAGAADVRGPYEAVPDEVLEHAVSTALNGHPEARDSEVERVFDALETSREGIGLLDGDGEFVYVNRAYADIYGYEPDELIGERWEFLYPEGETEELYDEAFPALEAEGKWSGETTGRRKDGSRIVADHTLAAADDGLVWVVRDVTDRRQLEEELRQVLDRIDDAVYAVDNDWRLTYVNDQMTTLTGMDEDDLVGRCIWDVFPDAEGTPLYEKDVEAMETGEPVAYEGYYESHDAWYECRVYPSETGLSVYFRDVTERRERERQLREERELTERIVETSPVGITVVDADGEMAFANERAERILGRDAAEIRSYTHDDDRWNVVDERGDPIPSEELPFSRVIESGESVLDELLGIDRPDGSRVWISANCSPLYHDGEIDGGVYVFEDVTEQRRLEGELAEVYGRISDAVFALDADWNFTYLNERADELINPADEDLVGENVWEAFPEAVGMTFEEEYRRAMETQEPVSFEEYFPPLEAWFAVEAYPSETGLSVYFRDVTERREQRRRLEEQEAVLRETHGIISDRERSFEEKLDALLEVGREAIGTDYASLSRVDGDEYTFEAVSATDDSVREGDVVPLSATNCERAIATEETLVLNDVAADAPELADRAGNAEWGISCYLGAPVFLDDDVYGTFCFYDDAPREEPFSDWQVTLVDLWSRWISFELERTARERDLEEYETIVETIADGVYILDEDLRFQLVNRAFADLTDYSREELVGAHASLLFDEEDVASGRRGREELLAGEREVGHLESELRTGHGAIDVEILFTLLPFDDEFRGTAGVVRDVTERKERERALEQYRSLTRAANDVIVTIDTDSTIRSVNPAAEEVFGYDPEALVGESLTRLMSEELAASHREGIARYLETGEKHLDWDYVELPGRRADGSEVPLAVSFNEVVHEGERYFTGVMRDVTERKELERELRLSSEALQELYGVTSSTELSFDEKLDRVLELGAERLGLPHGFLTRIEDDVQTVVESRGDHDLLQPGESCPLSRAYCRKTIESDGLVEVYEAGDSGEWSDDPAYETFGLEAYVGAKVVVNDEIYGTLCFASRESRERSFTDAERTFVELASQWVAYELGRQQHEAELERQRDRMTALNQLNAIIRDISHEIIDVSSREEIEQRVCERLVESGGYRFAWAGSVDRGDRTVTADAVAGVGRGYLEDVTITIDEDETGQGPTGRALRTREPQFMHDILKEPDYEPWREQALERGYQSSAAIPIGYEDALYGVLNVYASEPYAFDGVEGEILAQLGRIVGHAIGSVERRKALLGDTVTELEFQLGAADHPLREVTVDGGRITFERTIPTGDDGVIHFVAVSGIDLDEFEAAVDRHSSVESVRLIAEREDDALFELTVPNPPLSTTLIRHGGQLERAIIERGEFRVITTLPRDADVRSVIETIDGHYPGTEVLAQRTRTREGRTAQEYQPVLTDRLTEKQRAAIETAYFAGYFDWPRTTTGEEVSELLDCSPATFTEHLRIAERKVFGALFEEESG